MVNTYKISDNKLLARDFEYDMTIITDDKGITYSFSRKEDIKLDTMVETTPVIDFTFKSMRNIFEAHDTDRLISCVRPKMS